MYYVHGYINQVIRIWAWVNIYLPVFMMCVT